MIKTIVACSNEYCERFCRGELIDTDVDPETVFCEVCGNSFRKVTNTTVKDHDISGEPYQHVHGYEGQ